jgi:ribosome-binding protein aMBF1 (putative translation factor)
VGFWDGVQTILLEGNGIAFLLPDQRLVSVAEMDRRERAYKAGRDPDAPFSPAVDAVDHVLGAIITRERLARRLSQRQLAADSGVTQSMVARLETGSREPSWRTFRLLLDAMALDPVVHVRAQTTAPSSSSGSDGGPGRML